MHTPVARDLGIPVRAVTWVKVFAGSTADGKPCLYAAMGQSGARFMVLRIDRETGRCTKFLAAEEGGAYPVSAIWSRKGNCLYLGSYTGRLHRFVPGVERVETLGQINPGAANFTCAIAEHPDGALFIGSHPGCDFTRYDPATGEFTRYGRMAPDDMYFYPMAGTDGTVAGMVKVMRPHVVVLDPATGAYRTVGPIADPDAKHGHVELLAGGDGQLYIRSHEGNYRLEGMDALPVAELPPAPPPPALADGSTWRWLDADVAAFRRLAITGPDGSERVLELDWEGDGSDIFLCHAGPDGKVYGSSVLPEHFFSHTPATGALTDHGACSTSSGEAYSMANLDGRIYIASYPAARVSVYDPSRPYRFGTDRDANPREIGRIDDVSYRPFAMVAGPAGKVWIASVPDYGIWGGTLAWFAPETETFRSHRHIVQDCSPSALTYIEAENLLLVGISVSGGSGTRPRATQGAFVLWDPDRDSEVWRGDLGLSIHSVVGLCAAGSSLAYALIIDAGQTTHSLVLLDTHARRLVSQTALSRPPHGHANPGLVIHGGYVYGFTSKGIFRAALGTTDALPYWGLPACDGAPGAEPVLSVWSGALVGRSLYFGCRSRLLCVPLE